MSKDLIADRLCACEWRIDHREQLCRSDIDPLLHASTQFVQNLCRVIGLMKHEYTFFNSGHFEISTKISESKMKLLGAAAHPFLISERTS